MAATGASAQAVSDSAAVPPFRPAPPPQQAPTQFQNQPQTQPQTMRPVEATPKTRAFRLHLHGGLFAPVDVNATSPTIGLRFGRRLVSHVQAGFLTALTFERKNLGEPVNGLPGLQPQRILARADGQLIPAMLFLQVDLNDTRFIVPYFGIAAGKEWLTLKASDFRNDARASTKFENYAWEGWGGIGMRLGSDMSFDTELFYNGGSLEREAEDSSGKTWTEAVDVNGVGARVGVNFLFW